jgi:type II secretory pathway component GspD/PulD (secretin)
MSAIGLDPSRARSENGSMKTSLRVLWLVGLAVCAGALAQSLEIIQLRHRTAEEVIPVLQPLLESGGSLSGKDDQLFVRASSANLAQLRSAIAAIDKPPRQLLVSVRRSSRQEMERRGLIASGTLSDRNSSVSAGESGRRSSGVTVRATDSSSREQVDGVSSVRVVEGGAAFISTGESVPIVTAIAGVDRRGPWVAGSTEYRDLRRGFIARPRVAGDRIIIDIEQQDERRGRGGEINSQSVTTQVSATAGEWVQLGGIEESASVEQRGITGRTYSTRGDELSLWVKVEVAQ